MVCQRAGHFPDTPMPIRSLVLATVVVLGMLPMPPAAGAGQPPRLLEMAIAKDEMIAPGGALQSRAAEALHRMSTRARDQGARFTVQIPADAFDSAAEIQRVAPFASIKRVPARRPFKLVLRVDGDSDRPSRPGSSEGWAPPSLDDRDDNSFTPQVYLHIRDPSQSGTASEYAAILRDAGAYVSDVEIMVADGPRRNQLRYFHREDRPEAVALARKLSAGVGAVQLLDLSKEYGNSVPMRRYELWLAPHDVNAARRAY